MSLLLEPGTLVGDRYRIERLLGRGGFSAAYLASDTLSERKVVLKELLPPGAHRDPDGVVFFAEGGDAAHRLLHGFMEEARLLAKLRSPNIVTVYTALQWSGTAYSVMEFLEHSRPLSMLMAARGAFSVDDAVQILTTTAIALGSVHELGFLHRDVKPSNILVSDDGEVTLIDFGAAREWHADVTVRHTALFTPGYAPIEQLSELGKRGPASDLYSLAATGWQLLTGEAPPSAVDRVAGAPLPPLAAFRNDVPPEIEATLRQALSVRAIDRPQSAAEFVSLLRAEPARQEPQLSRIDILDGIKCRLQKQRIRASQCPGCGSLLSEPKPLKPGTCGVCRSGKIVERNLDQRRCAVCRTGLLKAIDSQAAPFCPLCRYGHLRSKGVLKKTNHCDACGARFERSGRTTFRLIDLGITIESLFLVGQEETEVAWARAAGRAPIVFECETCHAQFDELSENRWKLSHVCEDTFGVSVEHETRSPGEWARIAARLPIDAGNAACASCGADYYLDGENITLLDADSDPYGFLEQNHGRCLPLDCVPWIAVAKLSGEPGVLCDDCGTEFDYDHDYLRLRSTQHPLLRPHVDRALPVEDWHRVADDLPLREDEADFNSEFDWALRDAIRAGEIAWGDSKRNRNRWQSPCCRLVLTADGYVSAGKGKLTITDESIDLTSRGKSFQIPTDAVISAQLDEDAVILNVSGEVDPIVVSIEPVELTIQLESGRYEIEMSSEDLTAIINSFATHTATKQSRPYAS